MFSLFYWCCPLQDTVSVHRPSFYADRFQKFMCNTVFKKPPCKFDSYIGTFATTALKCWCIKDCFFVLTLVKTSPSKKSRVGPVSGGKKSNIAVSGQSQQSLPVAAEQTQPQQTTVQLSSSGALSLSPDTQGDSGMRKTLRDK